MRHLFYFYSCFNYTMFGCLMDEAKKLIEKGDEVYFMTCDGVNHYCLFNKGGSKGVCSVCKYFTRSVLKKYNIYHVLMSHYCKKQNAFFEYKDSKELRSIKYRNVSIGMGIMSSYISATRNFDPLINVKTREYFDMHLQQNVNYVNAVYAAIEDIKPDTIYTFNGRYEENRPIYDIAKELGIELYLTEVIRRGGIYYKTRFHNSLPHNIKENILRRIYCWEHYDMSEDEKIKLGKSFYKKRRAAQDSGDVKIYVASQKEWLVPNMKDGRINIAIMNSSEDEFAAVGEDWDTLKLFDSQLDGIEYLLKYAPKECYFYLRIHPNLAGIPYNYHNKLNKLESLYDNITIIPATSDVSTYTLMEKVDKVVCFGSTMGIESSYWGKPSILLGPSLYYYDDVVYVPKSKEEALSLLTKSLLPKFNENIIKFGAYILNKDPLVIDLKSRYKYVNFDIIKKSFMHNDYHISPFMNLYMSAYFSCLLIAILRGIFEKIGNGKNIPTLERN